MADAAVLTKQLTAGSITNTAQAQSLAAAGALVLNGAVVVGGVAVFDTQRRLGIASNGNDSGITFTIKGANDTGAAISEVLAGSNGGTAQSLLDYRKVTSIVGSGATASTVTAGTTGVGSTPWYIPTSFVTPFAVDADVEIVSGTANATVETTDDSPLAPMPIYTAGYSMTVAPPVANGWPGLTGVAVNSYSTINRNVAGIRLTVNSGQGLIRSTLRQSGLIQGP